MVRHEEDDRENSEPVDVRPSFALRHGFQRGILIHMWHIVVIGMFYFNDAGSIRYL